MATSKSDKVAGIGTEAVKKATGRDWPQWIRALNAAGAKDMDHKAIADMVSEKFGVAPWWTQMVTVGYEQAAKGRVKHSKGSVFEVSGSRTVSAPVGRLFRAWLDAKARADWLPERVEIRKVARNKSMRVTWLRDATLVSVNFWGKGPGKSQVQVGHGKIKSAAAAAKMKKLWAKRLGDLKLALEAE